MEVHIRDVNNFVRKQQQKISVPSYCICIYAQFFGTKQGLILKLGGAENFGLSLELKQTIKLDLVQLCETQKVS